MLKIAYEKHLSDDHRQAGDMSYVSLTEFALPWIYQ